MLQAHQIHHAFGVQEVLRGVSSPIGSRAALCRAEERTPGRPWQFIAFSFQSGRSPLQSLDELAGATLRVDYSLPGWFQWGCAGEESYTRWVVPLKPGPRGRRVPRPPVRERTREAALQALRRVDPQVREALVQAIRRADPRVDATPPVDEAQIFPTGLNLKIVYVPGATNARPIQVITTLGEIRHGGG